MSKEATLWGFVEQYVHGLRAELPGLIKSKDFVGIDYIMEMQKILLNKVASNDAPLVEGYLCDLKQSKEKQQILRELDFAARVAGSHYDLEKLKPKILRTFRDTYYRLCKDGCLPERSSRDGKEVLFNQEELLIILLEKRMANKRIRKERKYLYKSLSHDQLAELMRIHPKDFNEAIEAKIVKAQIQNAGLSDEANDKVSKKSSDLEAEDRVTTYQLHDTDHSATLTLPANAPISPEYAEEVLRKTATALGMKLDASDLLLMKALAMKVKP